MKSERQVGDAHHIDVGLGRADHLQPAVIGELARAFIRRRPARAAAVERAGAAPKRLAGGQGVVHLNDRRLQATDVDRAEHAVGVEAVGNDPGVACVEGGALAVLDHQDQGSARRLSERDAVIDIGIVMRQHRNDQVVVEDGVDHRLADFAGGLGHFKAACRQIRIEQSRPDNVFPNRLGMLADDRIRIIRRADQQTFPGFGGAILRIIDHAAKERPGAEIVPTHDITPLRRLDPHAASTGIVSPLCRTSRKVS